MALHPIAQLMALSCSLAYCVSCKASPSVRATDPPLVRQGAKVPPAKPRSFETPKASTPERLGHDLTLIGEFDCADNAVITPAGERAFFVCGSRLMDIVGDSVVESVALNRGVNSSLENQRRPMSLIGAWPSSVWLAASEPVFNGNSVQTKIYHWSGVNWRETLALSPTFAGNSSPLLFPWANNATLVVAAAMPETPQVAVVPKGIAPHLSLVDHERDPTCGVSMRHPELGISLGVGDVMLFSGQICGTAEVSGADAAGGAPHIGVERLQAGKSVGQFSLLPPAAIPPPKGTIWAVTAAIAPHPDEVFVAARGFGAEGSDTTPSYFARFDGKTWTAQASPLGSAIAGLWVENEESLLASDLSGRLWRGHNNIWSAIDFTPPTSQVWVRGQNDIWLLTALDGKHQLYQGGLKRGAGVTRFKP